MLLNESFHIFQSDDCVVGGEDNPKKHSFLSICNRILWVARKSKIVGKNLKLRPKNGFFNFFQIFDFRDSNKIYFRILRKVFDRFLWFEVNNEC